jgi:hypothetical protein
MSRFGSFIGRIFGGKDGSSRKSVRRSNPMGDRLERLKRNAAGAPPPPPRYAAPPPAPPSAPPPVDEQFAAFAPEPDDCPFGEDILNPDARALPPHFHGEWARDLDDYDTARRTILGAERMTVDGSTEERVIAVRFIDADSIAVVGLPVDDTGKNYTLRYFGVSEDRSRLTDLENMDWVLQRCPAGFTG